MADEPPKTEQHATGDHNAQAMGAGAYAGVFVTNAPPPLARGSSPPLPRLLLGREEDIVRLKARPGVPEHEDGEGRAHRFKVIRGWPG